MALAADWGRIMAYSEVFLLASRSGFGKLVGYRQCVLRESSNPAGSFTLKKLQA